MKPLLAMAIALALATPVYAAAHAAEPPASAQTGSTAPPAWVANSNRHAHALMQAEAAFSPESAAMSGLSQYDGLVTDLGPGLSQRRSDALAKEKAKLQLALQLERDPNVRQDLQIMIDVVDLRLQSIALSDRYTRDWTDATQRVFRGQQALS